MDNMGSYSQAQWSGWAYNAPTNNFSGYTQLPSYAAYLPESMDIYNAQQSHLIHHQQMARTTESKPRLSKEEVEILETEFQKNHKPNSSTKKALAEQMRVDNARINNWFQNRRAREKKEKNIREYAARQNHDKNPGAVEGDASHNDRCHNRVASSAPFPNPRRPSTRSDATSASLAADLATPEHGSEASQSAGSSPEMSAAVSDRALSFDSVDANDYMALKQEGSSPAFMPNPTAQFLSMTEASAIQDPALFSNFNQYPRLVVPGAEDEPIASFPQPCFTGTAGLSPNSVQDSYSQYSESDLDENTISDADSQGLKSAPSMDIASRRNRRPPHLAISASRSYSACGPRTGIDMGRRVDVGGSMRRVASATGTVRISKPSGTPRSPFFERSADALFQLNRSPSFTAATATIAPPTPDTPIVSAQQGLCEVNAGPALPTDPKLSSGLVIVQDPTLRTPPTTPGIIDNMFALNAGYEGGVFDEPLVTPGLGSFPTDFEVPNVSNNVPNYVANGCASQPQTPSYNSQMGPNYFGYSGGNAEYNWSDASASAKSSPGQSHRQVQFMNMTPSSFTGVEK